MTGGSSGAEGASRPRWLARVGAKVRVDAPGEPSALGVALIRSVFGPYVRLWFRPVLEGAERLPPGPCLIVANHSGGGMADVLCVAWLFSRVFLGRRRVTGMAHPAAFFVPIMGSVLRALGAIPSTYDAALAALGQGVSVIVFPGGDHEAARPIWQARRVDFAGRQGFLRLARSAWVPVVPMGIAGAHVVTPILWRSWLLPRVLFPWRLIGVKSLPVTVLLVAGLAVLGLVVAPRTGYPLAALLGLLWAFFPSVYQLPLLPSPVRVKLGEPIAPEALFGSREESGPLDASYARVLGAVQELVRPA